MSKRAEAPEELIDVRRAAVLVGRNPETVRRWVWSGRLEARRSGRRLLVAPAEVRAMAGRDATAGGLRQWADLARAARGSGSDRSAADLVIEDRQERSGTVPSDARR